MRVRFLALAASALLAGALLAGATPARAESAAELYYERAVMSAAGARCGLFTADIAAALASGEAQARNAALRGGASATTLDAALGRANARAGAAACAGQDVKTAADRVRQAFRAYASMSSMTFPGQSADWRAQRGQNLFNSAWRLSQSARAGQDRMIFGLSGKGADNAVTAVASFADGATPYAARLVMRDPARAPEPYIANLTGAAPLYARLPPAQGERVVLAEAREAAETALLPPGASQAVAFHFPAQALGALSALDPREAVAVDFVFAGPQGDGTRRAYFEVGDFSAGVAFLRVAQR